MAYAFFDGDDIGPTVEILLLEGRIIEAQAFSNSIKEALQEIEVYLRSFDWLNIIIIGGDDILLEVNTQSISQEFLEKIRQIFKDKTGNSISCGVGDNLTEAIFNLRLAKLYGKDAVRGWK